MEFSRKTRSEGAWVEKIRTMVVKIVTILKRFRMKKLPPKTTTICRDRSPIRLLRKKLQRSTNNKPVKNSKANQLLRRSRLPSIWIWMRANLPISFSLSVSVAKRTTVWESSEIGWWIYSWSCSLRACPNCKSKRTFISWRKSCSWACHSAKLKRSSRGKFRRLWQIIGGASTMPSTIGSRSRSRIRSRMRRRGARRRKKTKRKSEENHSLHSR